jgi:hypothetical protein
MTKNKPVYDKTIVVPVEYDQWKALRKVSYDHEISMSQLAREAIDKVINKYNKSIDL